MTPSKDDLIKHIKNGYGFDTWINERGNTVYRSKLSSDRYKYDQLLRGWKQFDTNQDAWYFGVWVNIEDFMTFTYCEGDILLVVCPTKDHLRAELEDAEKFYGEAPPAAVGINLNGNITKYYDKRPQV